MELDVCFRVGFKWLGLGFSETSRSVVNKSRAVATTVFSFRCSLKSFELNACDFLWFNANALSRWLWETIQLLWGSSIFTLSTLNYSKPQTTIFLASPRRHRSPLNDQCQWRCRSRWLITNKTIFTHLRSFGITHRVSRSLEKPKPRVFL